MKTFLRLAATVLLLELAVTGGAMACWDDEPVPTATLSVSVTGAPQFSCGSGCTTVWVGTNVSFSADSADDYDTYITEQEDGVRSYEWDFGDESDHSYYQSTSHTYTQPGSYTVGLTLDDSERRTHPDGSAYYVYTGTKGDDEAITETYTVNVIDATLSSVQWGSNTNPTNGFTVTDDNGTAYSTPQWVAASGGDAEVRNPYCYTQSTSANASYANVTAEVSVQGLPGGFDMTCIRMKGESSYGNIPATGVSCSCGPSLCIVSLTDNTHITWPSGVRDITDLSVAWYISIDGGSTWKNAGTSHNEIFNVLGTPGCSINRRTVLHLACQNGGDSPSACKANTWGMFTGLNVQAWNKTAQAYTRDLYYYQGGFTGIAQHFGNMLHSDTPPSGRDGDGNCTAWTELLKECWLVNNVSNINKTTVHGPYDNINPPWYYIGFGVKIIQFGAPSYYPGFGIWKHSSQDFTLTDQNDAGQNTHPPAEKLFGVHYIVHCTNDDLYYDPSYGVTATGPSGYTNSYIDAWERSTPDTHWANQSDALITLIFQDGGW